MTTRMRRWSSLAVLATVSSLLSVTSIALADEPLPPPAQPAPTTMPPPATPPTPPGPPGPPHGGWGQGHGQGQGHGRGHMGPPPPFAGEGGATAPGGTGPREAQGRRVTATVDAGPEKNAVLERLVKTEESSGRFAFVVPVHASTETWEQVCVAPCRLELDRASTYRVGAANKVARSTEFTLPPSESQLQLQIKPGDLYWHHVGTKLVVLGTAAAIVGGALIVTASDWEDRSEEKRVRTAGIITAGVALVLLGVGIPLAIVTQTHVHAGEKKLARGVHLGPGGLTF